MASYLVDLRGTLAAGSRFVANLIYHTNTIVRELIGDQLVKILVVKPLYPDLSPRLGMSAHIFLDLFQDLLALCFQW